MAHFIFKLEGVLRFRKNVEHERQRDLAVVQAQMTALEAELRALDADVQSVNDDVRQNHLVGSVDPAFLIAHRRFQAGAQRKAMGLAEKIAAVQVKRDAARRALAEAAKEHKVLDKLREKQHDAWRAELSRKEAQTLDEVTMQMTYRNMRDEPDSLPAASESA